jgi:mRNA interferase HigB
MKVRLIKKKSIEDFAEQNATSRNSFRQWLSVVKHADWALPEEIKETFHSADLLGNGTNRVVFDIAGNNYRMICKYHFGEKEVVLYIKWIGSHADYTRLCICRKQFTIESFKRN